MSFHERVTSRTDRSVIVIRPGSYGSETVHIRTYHPDDPWAVGHYSLVEVLSALSRVTGRRILVENTPGMSEVPV